MKFLHGTATCGHTVGLLSLSPMLPKASVVRFTVSVVQSYGKHTGNEVTLTVKV